ncbi:MAG TPA: hypothetical protein VGI75_10455 [Pirellulales bacterium]
MRLIKRRAIMNLIAKCASRFLIGLMVLTALAIAPIQVHAQAAWGNLIAQGVPHSDTVPFVLVAFCLILAFMIVCRSANRSPESKLQDLDQM